MSARPALTWTLLWLAVASAVAVGIVAGFLILRLLAPDVAIAASRPVAQPTAPVDVSRSASAARLPGAPTGRSRPRDATQASGAPPSPSVAASPRPPNREMTRPMRLADAAVTTTGIASWWASLGPGIYAALPGYVAGTHVRIRVWSGELHVDAPVITSCQCYVGTPDERIVDLSRDAFARLADPSRGLVPVFVEVLAP